MSVKSNRLTRINERGKLPIMRKKAKAENISLYPITLEPHEEGGYFATCPVFQGCHAEGESMGEALDNIRDVIRAHIEARKKIGEPTPSVNIPRDIGIRFTLPVPVNG